MKGIKELFDKPRKLTEKEKEKLQSQFPHIKVEDRLKKNKEERITNKI